MFVCLNVFLLNEAIEILQYPYFCSIFIVQSPIARSTTRRRSRTDANRCSVTKLREAVGTIGNDERTAANDENDVDDDIELFRALDKMAAHMNVLIREELMVPRLDVHGVMKVTCLRNSDVGEHDESSSERETRFDVEELTDLGWASLENVCKGFVAEIDELHTTRYQL